MLYEQVYAAHKTAKEAPMLAQSKRLNYLDANTNALLEDNSILNKTIKLMSWCRNNWGWVIKKPDQSIGQLDTSLTDFDAVTMLGYQIVAAISGVQSARLLETSPKGWQSSGSLEDKNYSKLLANIQKTDFCPILDLHYKLLAKSEYGINKKFVSVFDEIDNPTEKERAEIRKINADTDSVYINAGVVSPEEIRNVLRADEKSGYTALGEEMEGEPLPDEENDFFNEEGGSSTEQDPFSMDDDDDIEFRTTKNGVKFPLKEDESTEESCKEFFEEKKEEQAKLDKDLKYSWMEQILTMIELDISEAEFMDVGHSINDVYYAKYKNKKNITHITSNFIYKAKNKGFNNYEFYDKIRNERVIRNN